MKNLLAWLAALILTVLAIAPGLSGGFLFDDYPNIVDNPAIRIADLSPSALASVMSGPSAGPLGRPVSVLSFALTYHGFGLAPFAFKAINLGIHLLNGLLAGWLIHLIVSALPGANRQISIRWLPLWVAAIWLFHPINIVPIILTVQRMTLLSGLFVLLALVGHVKGLMPGPRRWVWLATAWLLLWPLAILSKETGLLFPLYALLTTLLLKPPRLLPVLAVGALLTGIMASAVVGRLGWEWLEAGYAMRNFSLAERLLTEARVLWFYLAQIVLPAHTDFGIYLDDFVVSKGLMQPPQTIMALAGWATVVTLIMMYWRCYPLACFGLAWFLAGHLLESTFLPLEIAFEYRNYLPSIGPILAVAGLGAQLLSRVRMDHPRATAAAVALLPVVTLALLTWMRADQWSEPLRGNQIEAVHHPHSARANYALALALMQSGRGDADNPIGGKMVLYHFSEAAASDPTFKLAHLGLLTWACASGRPVEPEWLDDFSRRLESTPYGPRDKELPADLAKQLVGMPRCLDRAQALRLFEAGSRNMHIARSLQARFLEAAGNYELLALLDPPAAKGYFLRALKLDDGNMRLQENIKSLDSGS